MSEQEHYKEFSKSIGDVFADYYKAWAEQLGCPGWHYRDIPWITDEYFDKLIDIIGKDNIKCIVSSRRDNAIRGQFLISPEGIENIKEWQKTDEYLLGSRPNNC